MAGQPVEASTVAREPVVAGLPVDERPAPGARDKAVLPEEAKASEVPAGAEKGNSGFRPHCSKTPHCYRVHRTQNHQGALCRPWPFF